MLQKLHLRYAIKCHAYLALAVLFALVCEQRADGPGRKERKSPLRHKIRLLTLLKRTRAGSLGSGAFDSGAQIGKPADDWLWAGQQADASFLAISLLFCSVEARLQHQNAETVNCKKFI